jgi:hypothetical protein
MKQATFDNESSSTGQDISLQQGFTILRTILFSVVFSDIIDDNENNCIVVVLKQNNYDIFLEQFVICRSEREPQI